jgi:hypothetical protein
MLVRQTVTRKGRKGRLVMANGVYARCRARRSTHQESLSVPFASTGDQATVGRRFPN